MNKRFGEIFRVEKRCDCECYVLFDCWNNSRFAIVFLNSMQIYNFIFDNTKYLSYFYLKSTIWP